MLITIIADASYCPETKVAGYAFWVASARGKFGGDGPMKNLCDTNNVAEMQAMVNGLHQAIVRGYAQDGDEILIQTDCLAAIGAFDGGRKNLINQEQECVAIKNELQLRYNLNIRYKHVKGHTNNDDPRYASNRACDQKARRAMRKARDKHRINLIKELLNEKQSPSVASDEGLHHHQGRV